MRDFHLQLDFALPFFHPKDLPPADRIGNLPDMLFLYPQSLSKPVTPYVYVKKQSFIFLLKFKNNIFFVKFCIALKKTA